MFELSGLSKGVWARRLRGNSKKAGEMTVAALKRYQTRILLILAINAYTTSVLIHDFPGKTIFGLVWLVAFGAALITVILSSESAAPRPARRWWIVRFAVRFAALPGLASTRCRFQAEALMPERTMTMTPTVTGITAWFHRRGTVNLTCHGTRREAQREFSHGRC